MTIPKISVNTQGTRPLKTTVIKPKQVEKLLPEVTAKVAATKIIDDTLGQILYDLINSAP